MHDMCVCAVSAVADNGSYCWILGIRVKSKKVVDEQQAGDGNLQPANP